MITDKSDAREVVRQFPVDTLRVILERVRVETRFFTPGVVAELIEYIIELREERERLLTPKSGFIN